MPLLTELFILFGLNYKDVAPTALNAAFFGIQERAGQKLKREIQSQRLNETGCKHRCLFTADQAMSLRNRIIVCVAICVFIFLIGLGAWMNVLGYHHPIYNAVMMFFMLLSIGTFILYIVYRCLRSGVITINPKGSGLVSVYDRRRNPFGFWFYILLFSLIGLLSCGTGIYFLLPYSK
jgi:hypothetical protein